MQIHVLDLNFQNTANTIASYLLIGPDGPVLVETGPGSTLPVLKSRLAEHDLSPQEIKHVLVTHIHLDHAGSAGWWARKGAQIYVHHVGAPHLIDPSKLLSSAGRIYGEAMDSLWGEVLPAPAEKVTPVHDGDVISAAGLAFTAMDTPGHAYHHHVYRVGDVAFTGDAAGIHIPGPSFVDLPAPPPEFNLDLWRKSLERLRDMPVEAIYPTHFGRVDDWRKHLDVFEPLMLEAVEFVRIRMEGGLEREEILSQYLAWQQSRAAEAGVDELLARRYELSNPLFMSVDGIMRYWRTIASGR